MKICMLTSGHDIYDNRIYYKEILSLKKKYKQIYLLAPGEKDFITEDGIIVKCFNKRKNWFDRLRPMREMFDIAKEIRADIYHAHEPDSFQVALKLKRVLNSKAIFDSHEYHPEAFAEHFRVGNKLVEKITYLYEKSLAKKADYIISVNDILINKFKQYNRNVELLPNYPVMSMEKFEKSYDEKPVFIYVGGLREDRGILKILEAIKCVKSQCQYIFVGAFENDEFEVKVNNYIKHNLKNKDVIFTGKVPHIKVFDYLKIATVGFVLLQPTNWRYINSEPIKIFEYMMSKTAVIASDFPMMRRIMEESLSGEVVKPDVPEKIANCIDNMVKEKENTKLMGINGYNEVRKKYNWDVCEKRLLKLYGSLE